MIRSLTLAAIALAASCGIASAQCEFNVRYSKNMPNCVTTGKPFTFPNKDGVHYVTRKQGKAAIGDTVFIRFSIIGPDTLVPTEGEPPAKLRLMLQQQGDTLTAAEEDKRWWSAPVVLTPGEHTLAVKIDPALWTNVFGKVGTSRPNGFKTAISKIGNSGFTFGGMFAGHGVFAKSGKVEFVLHSFAMQSKK